MVAAHLSLLFIFLQIHCANIVPDSKHNSAPSFLFDIQDLGQFFAQLVSLWNFVSDETDSNIQVFLRGPREL